MDTRKEKALQTREIWGRKNLNLGSRTRYLLRFSHFFFLVNKDNAVVIYLSYSSLLSFCCIYIVGVRVTWMMPNYYLGYTKRGFLDLFL